MRTTEPEIVYSFPTSGFLALPNRLDGGALRVLESKLAGRQVWYLVETGHEPAADLLALLGRGGKVVGFDVEPEGFEEFSERMGAHFAAGGVAVYVPGRAIARRGTLMLGRSAAYQRLLLVASVVVPVLVDKPREGLLAIEKSSDAPETVVAIGPALELGNRTLARVHENWLLLWAESFSKRPLLRSHLAYALLAGLKRHGSKTAIIDGMDGSKLSYDRVLAASIALAQHLRTLTDKPRVGIVLPPGKAGLIANIAVLFAGKTPVNLNYTAGNDAVESAVRQADLDRFITVDAFVRRMQKFPWPPNRDLIFLERELPALKPRITRWFILSKILPTALLAARLGIPRTGDDAEAVLLFTSGSSGEPKGVPLSHRNVLGNTVQFASRLDFHEGDSLLGSLPLFHSFGCTVTLWYPIIEGIKLVTFPSPLEVDRIAALVQEYQVSLLIATPTFLRGYLRKAKPEQLAPLKFVITGAEKLPMSLAETFEKKFGQRVLEGYGLTETSPVTNFNLSNLAGDGSTDVVPTHRLGSVGHFVPGLAVRVTDAVTDEPLPPDQSGILWFKGANVFNGYLHWGAKNREVVRDGWFRTGDIGRIDDDGFLYIEGRLSRFSKIGGEMVPHERVEEYITRALGLEGEDTRKVVIVGVPDPAKGEALVLLSTIAGEYLEQEMIDLRYRLLEMNVPALWVPRKMVKVDDIPVLASGKLDLRACEALAKRVAQG